MASLGQPLIETTFGIFRSCPQNKEFEKKRAARRVREGERSIFQVNIEI